jgi:hypothetical protein
VDVLTFFLKSILDFEKWTKKMSKNEKHRKIMVKKVHTDHKKKLASGVDNFF